ncbi:hypothetical protein GUJ93_ZPchr0013g37650 [Zizania palustris]|uniref:Nuclear transcription factor Y subunit n=1 Tax=Zizania palustris TaxID=103762 RepID=A0A8J6BY76_ZIZPA|nr:hypothetical protein GUJ93_ZPchr0013g37650 [Zizania palustris]
MKERRPGSTRPLLQCSLHCRNTSVEAERENMLVEGRKLYLHESRHRHAMRRARGSGGRFLNTKKEEGSSGGRGAVLPIASLVSRNPHPGGARCTRSGGRNVQLLRARHVLTRQQHVRPQRHGPLQQHRPPPLHVFLHPAPKHHGRRRRLRRGRSQSMALEEEDDVFEEGRAPRRRFRRGASVFGGGLRAPPVASEGGVRGDVVLVGGLWCTRISATENLVLP